MASQEIKISSEIAAGEEEASHITPPSGKLVRITQFWGEAAYSKNSAVKLVWDWGGAGETVIWTIKGSSHMPFVHELTDADGTKKLAVALDNGETGAVFMSGFVDVFIED